MSAKKKWYRNRTFHIPHTTPNAPPFSPKNLPQSSLTIALIACAINLLLPYEAHAGFFDFFGIASRDISLAGAATALTDDPAAAFLNPAALTQRKVVQLSASFVGMLPSVTITQPPQNNPTASADDSLTARDPNSQSGISIGALFPFGGKINHRIALAFILYIPTSHVLAIDSLDPQTPRWYRYHSALDRLHLAASIAYEPIDGLSLGIGFQALAALDGNISVDLDLINDQIDRRDLRVTLINKAALIAGIHTSPGLGLRLGLSYRSPLDLTYDIPLRFNLGADAFLDLHIQGSDLYTPHTTTLGIALDLSQHLLPQLPLLFSLDLKWSLWSLAPDPTMRVTVFGDGALLSSLGLSDILSFDSGRSPPAGFRDTWSLHLGSEYTPLPWLTARAGYAWCQSATAPQSGPTSYLDSDAHQLALGVGFSFPDPLAFNDKPLSIDAALQTTLHPSQTTQKSSPGDPIRSLTFSGSLWVASLSLRHDF